MEFPRRVFDGDGVRGDVDFGPTLMLNRQRCILCTRCVRFMRDIDGDAQINIIDRGYGSEIATFQEEGVHSLISGNLMDVCPVGAITTRDYRFKSRPWDNPNAADTICTQCEKGCNVTVWLKAKPEWAKGSRLVRVTPRFNPDVNNYWMCDIGRFNYHWIEGDDRLRRPLQRDANGASQPVSWHDAIAALADRLAAAGASNPDGVRFLLSAHASHEELFLFRRIAEGLRRSEQAAQAIDRRAGGISRRASPSTRGSRCRPWTRRTSTARACSVWCRARSATRCERPISRRSGRPSRPERCRRCTCSTPDPTARSGPVDWIVDARAARDAAVAHRPGRAADRSRARGGFRAAGRIVRGEGSVLYKRTGTAAGNRPRDSPSRRRDGGLADSRRTWASRLASRSITRARRRCARTSRRGSAAAASRASRRSRSASRCRRSHWLQASNPSERWKWDFMFQDLPPVKGSVDPTALPLPPGAIQLKEVK